MRRRWLMVFLIFVMVFGCTCVVHAKPAEFYGEGTQVSISARPYDSDTFAGLLTIEFNADTTIDDWEELWVSLNVHSDTIEGIKPYVYDLTQPLSEESIVGANGNVFWFRILFSEYAEYRAHSEKIRSIQIPFTAPYNCGGIELGCLEFDQNPVLPECDSLLLDISDLINNPIKTSDYYDEYIYVDSPKGGDGCNPPLSYGTVYYGVANKTRFSDFIPYDDQNFYRTGVYRSKFIPIQYSMAYYNQWYGTWKILNILDNPQNTTITINDQDAEVFSGTPLRLDQCVATDVHGDYYIPCGTGGLVECYSIDNLTEGNYAYAGTYKRFTSHTYNNVANKYLDSELLIEQDEDPVHVQYSADICFTKEEGWSKPRVIHLNYNGPLNSFELRCTFDTDHLDKVYYGTSDIWTYYTYAPLISNLGDKYVNLIKEEQVEDPLGVFGKTLDKLEPNGDFKIIKDGIYTYGYGNKLYAPTYIIIMYAGDTLVYEYYNNTVHNESWSDTNLQKLNPELTNIGVGINDGGESLKSFEMLILPDSNDSVLNIYDGGTYYVKDYTFDDFNNNSVTIGGQDSGIGDLKYVNYGECLPGIDLVELRMYDNCGGPYDKGFINITGRMKGIKFYDWDDCWGESWKVDDDGNDYIPLYSLKPTRLSCDKIIPYQNTRRYIKTNFLDEMDPNNRIDLENKDVRFSSLVQLFSAILGSYVPVDIDTVITYDLNEDHVIDVEDIAQALNILRNK